MITSTRNERVQAVRRLHRRSVRVAERRFVVEGPQAVREALDSLVELYAVDLDDPLAQQAAARGIEVVHVDDKVLEALAETVTPQGLVGIAPLLDHQLPRGPRLVAVLHEVNDPGNAGTVIRTADAAGADAVVLTQGSVDPHNGKCVRASAGSLWHVPVVSEADPLATIRLPGCSGPRPTGCPRTCSPPPTTGSGSRCWARPNPSTSRPPRPSACSPRRGPSGEARRAAASRSHRLPT